jgi:hypothetical protein
MLHTLKDSGHESLKGEMRNAYKIFVTEPEENEHLEDLRCRLKDNIKIDLKEAQYDDF